MVATPGNYDYIVVGGGSAGSVVAARLSESGRHRVLLLEAGPDDQTWSLRNFFVQMPLGYAKSYNDRRVNWRYHSEPNPGLGGRSVYVPRGRILGGSSSINALVYVQGQPQDYDGWEALGNPGWGAAEVRRLYRKLEMHPYGPSEHHGDGGPLGITDLDGRVHPLCEHYLNAASELGLKVNPDYNGESQEGVAPYQATLRHGRRASASRSYLWPARHRPNLRIVTHARATRILFEGLRAVGVAYSRHGRPLRGTCGSRSDPGCGCHQHAKAAATFGRRLRAVAGAEGRRGAARSPRRRPATCRITSATITTTFRAFPA